jgi:hypothetical protein
MNAKEIRNYTAGGAVTARRIVKFDGSGNIVQGAAATDLLIGVSTDIDAISAGPVDVIMGGTARIKAGGIITRGQQVTSDSAGKAVVAEPASGVTVRVIGIALETSADGDEIDVLLRQGALSNAEAES